MTNIKIVKEYKVSLATYDGCNFDGATFTNKKDVAEFIRGRGESYTAYINDQVFTCKNDRVLWSK